MLHQARSALIWLWIRQTSYFRRHFIVLHLVPCCTLDIVWYSWVRDIDGHLETDLDILCIGNLGYHLQHFTLHTFQTTSSSATTVVRPERFAAFRPSFMGQEWTLSHFPLSGFEGSLSSVYILYSILKRFCFIVRYCTVMLYWSQKHVFTNNPSLWWFHEYQIVKQSVRNKLQKKERKFWSPIIAKWSHSLEWMTPVPVSVSRILHKNSPLAIKTTYLSLSLLYLWYVLYFVFWIFVFSIFNFLICILKIASHSVHTSLCSALQTSLLYFGANLVIRAQPSDYILLHIVHMSVHCESILHCCTSSVKYPFHIVHQM